MKRRLRARASLLLEIKEQRKIIRAYVRWINRIAKELDKIIQEMKK